MYKILISTLLLLTVTVPSYATNFAGSIKNLEGQVYVKRNSADIPGDKGMKIYIKDTVWTGSDGSVSIILLDNTIFSLGPDSELALDEFIYEPANKHFSMLVRMMKGTFVYLSGVIGKLSPESINIVTPVGTISVRGTRFAAQVAPNQMTINNSPATTNSTE